MVCPVGSRNIDSAIKLCSRLSDAIPVDNLQDIIADADLYVISLVDHAVENVVRQLPRGNALWVHTSGSVDMEKLSPLSSRYGVLYPLQTFSRDVDVNMHEVPFFIEGVDTTTAETLHSIASRISDTVHYADGALRARMHVAAVFACNFTNYMFTVADDLLRRDDLDLSVLHPLLQETIRKAIQGSPAQGQTGPAVRGDRDIVKRHASTLPSDLSQIYMVLSDAIYKRHHS